MIELTKPFYLRSTAALFATTAANKLFDSAITAIACARWPRFHSASAARIVAAPSTPFTATNAAG